LIRTATHGGRAARHNQPAQERSPKRRHWHGDPPAAVR
jgi:hypothetical protein